MKTLRICTLLIALVVMFILPGCDKTEITPLSERPVWKQLVNASPLQITDANGNDLGIWSLKAYNKLEYTYFDVTVTWKWLQFDSDNTLTIENIEYPEGMEVLEGLFNEQVTFVIREDYHLETDTGLIFTGTPRDIDDN